MACRFKCTGSRPADYRTPSPPLASPLISPERDAREEAEIAQLRLTDCARDPSAPPASPAGPMLSAERETARREAENAMRGLVDAVRTNSVSTLQSDSPPTLSGPSSATLPSSGEGEDATPPPPAYVLPDMIPEGRDNLCILPSNKRRAQYMTIKPGEWGRTTKSLNYGVEDEEVVMQVHKLSEPLNQNRKHRVGIDAPWAPSAAAPGYTVRAHLEHAARFFENEVRNTLPAEPMLSDPEDEDSSSTSPTSPPLRQIRAEDTAKPFPLGLAPGEIYKGLNPPALDRPKASPRHNTWPQRPLGALDPAEMCYYQHQQRKKFLDRLISQGISAEEADARMERMAAETHGVVKTWAELEDEAQTAEMVLRVYGKLGPMEGWVEKEAGAPKRKAAPMGRGRARTVASSSRVAGAGSAGQGDAAAASADSEEAGSRDPSTASGATSTAASSTLASSSEESEETAPREKRRRKLTAKAQEAVDEESVKRARMG